MATGKGIPVSSLRVVTFPENGEDAYVTMIVKDEMAKTPSGYVNVKMSLKEFITKIEKLFPQLEEKVLKEAQEKATELDDALMLGVDRDLGNMEEAFHKQLEGIQEAQQQIARGFAQQVMSMSTALEAVKNAEDTHASKEEVAALKKELDEKLKSLDTGKSDGLDTSKLGGNPDGYSLTKAGTKAINAKALSNTLAEIGFSYDVRLGRWFLDEGELEEGDVDSAGGLSVAEQAKKDRDDADKSDDPALNPNRITTGGAGEKGEKDSNGNLIHDSSGGNIVMGADDKNNPGSDNADPTSAGYGKYYNNGKATDAKAPYAEVDAPVTRQNVLPALGSLDGTPYAYLDSLTPTRTSTVVSDGNLEIAMCPVVKGADPIEANADGYPIKMSAKTRWQFFLSFALGDTSNGSSILSLYPKVTYRLSDGAGKYIAFELKRQGKRLVLFDKVSNTTVYAGYQESDESTVQFLIRPELFTSTFAPYKVNDAGSLLGIYYADATADYIAGSTMTQRIQVNATSDGSFKDKVVYRPVTTPPDPSLFVKATNGASKGNTVFAFSSDSPRTFYLNVLDHTKTPIDLSGTFLTARSDDVYLSIGVLTNVGQRLDSTKPATLATPNRNGGYDIVVPPAKDNEKNGLYLAVIMYRKNSDGTLTAYADANAEAPRVAFRFMETTESNSYGGIFLSTYGSNTGGGVYKNKYDGSLGFDYKVGFPSRNYYLGGGIVSRDKLFGNNMANNGSANPLSGPAQIIFNLGLTGYTSKPETFPQNTPLLPYKTTAKNGGAITEFVYTGSFVLQATLEDMKTRNLVNFDIPINISVQGE